MRMPSHRWFSQPAALDSAVGAGTIGGNTLTGTVSSDFRSVHTDSAPVPTDFAPVSLITLFGGIAVGFDALDVIRITSKRLAAATPRSR